MLIEWPGAGRHDPADGALEQIPSARSGVGDAPRRWLLAECIVALASLDAAGVRPVFAEAS